ncbi:serine protease grass-like [Drosophila innubila]|uniref:serine protease grass-like n=1 Tax=Drosophila innubila TaxID=198719 RepID=UPI00148C9CE7|nr:serine protease grass-like [Drosophila innubila]
MYNIFLFVMALSLGTALQASLVENKGDDICVRRDGKPGYCVPLHSCSSISNMVQRKKMGIPFTSDETTYIQNSRCPVHKRGYVCCEAEDKVFQGIQELSSHKCGRFGEDDKAIGASEVKLLSRPWMALLYFRTRDGTNDFTCGGTLIHKRYVLTAAHCFNNQELLYVRLGEHNITSDTDCRLNSQKLHVCAPPVQNLAIERVFLHEQYSQQTGHNDIALVKLKYDVENTVSIKPICLPVNETLQKLVETLSIFRITGWGKTEYELTSQVPLETVVTKKDIKTCQESFTRKIVPTQICAGDRGRDSCNGDSGGPLIFPDLFNGQQCFVQFGIVSFGSASCGDGNPGVYTNVGSYVPWIAHKIATK